MNSPELDDLEQAGLAYLQLRNAIERALVPLAPLIKDRTVDSLTRSDITRAVLTLREALER